MNFIIEYWQALAGIVSFLFVAFVVLRRIDELVGKDPQGRTVVDRLERLEYQLFPNGGSSIKDQVTRLENCSHETREEIRLVQGEITIIRDMINILINKNN